MSPNLQKFTPIYLKTSFQNANNKKIYSKTKSVLSTALCNASYMYNVWGGPAIFDNLRSLKLPVDH